MSETTPLVIWIDDSHYRESVHKNAPGLSFNESYIGHLERRKDDDGDWSWTYIVKGVEKMAPSYAKARKLLEEAAIASLSPKELEPCGKCPHPAHVGRCQRAMRCNCLG